MLTANILMLQFLVFVLIKLVLHQIQENMSKVYGDHHD
jgi:hypothetical protein